MVEMRQNFHLVCQILRFLSDGDSGSRADFHICGDTYLGMEEEMSVADLTIRILVGFVKGRNTIHNLYPKLRCLLAVAKATITLSFLFQKNIDRLGKSHQAEHSGKTVSMDKAFFRQEIILEKAGLFHDKTNSLIHIAHTKIHDIGKLFLQKILSVLGPLGNIT